MTEDPGRYMTDPPANQHRPALAVEEAAPTPRDKAWVYLQRALGRGSKRLIASDIDRALSMLYSSHDAMSYLAEHKLPQTQRGLHTAARRLLDGMKEVGE